MSDPVTVPVWVLVQLSTCSIIPTGILYIIKVLFLNVVLFVLFIKSCSPWWQLQLEFFL